MKNLSILIYLLFYSYCFSQGTENTKETEKLIVRTKNHSKSLGIDLIIKYPKDWILTPGERPHILYNIKNESKTIYSTISVTDILEFANDKENSEVYNLDEKSLLELMVSTFPNKNNCYNHFIEGGHEKTFSPKCEITKIENLPSSLTSAYVTNERAGYELESYFIQYQIPFKTKIITVAFNYPGFKEEKDQILALIFTKSVMNTLVINNLWKK